MEKTLTIKPVCPGLGGGGSADTQPAATNQRQGNFKTFQGLKGPMAPRERPQPAARECDSFAIIAGVTLRVVFPN